MLVNFNIKNSPGFLGDKTKIIELFSKEGKVLVLNVNDFIWSTDKYAVRDLFTMINLIKIK